MRVHHRTIEVDGTETFYREAGQRGAPLLLLPHGYPCSSYVYRNLLPRLAERMHLLAPDFPGSGYSGTPERFDYSFDGFPTFLERFLERLGLGASPLSLYLHDFGSQIGLRFAIRNPSRVRSLVIQNGDIYEDTLSGRSTAASSRPFVSPTPRDAPRSSRA